jgi:hypothetical protein
VQSASKTAASSGGVPRGRGRLQMNAKHASHFQVVTIVRCEGFIS